MKIEANIPFENESFGLLTFLYADGLGIRNAKMAMYKCKCGSFVRLMISRVNCGYIKSCGCLKKTHIGVMTTTHGKSKEPLYYIWCGIISRCENEKHKRYSDYGGRGVKICPEWRNDFESFYNWAIENGWTSELQIDKDIKGNGLLYSPDSCLIVTRKQNVNKTKSNKYILYNGETKTVAEWCDIIGVNPFLVYKRLSRGWDAKEALETPNRNFNTALK